MPMSLPRQRPVRAGVARDRAITFKVTPAELAAIGEAARAAGVYPASEWVRRVVLVEAGLGSPVAWAVYEDNGDTVVFTDEREARDHADKAWDDDGKSFELAPLVALTKAVAGG